MNNLLLDRWLPAKRQSGSRCVISPAEITDAFRSDPVIEIDWPRPDFQVATRELLIGLLATTCPPESQHAWLDLWDSPPDPAVLADAFAPFAHAFNFDGDGPRFCQDLDELVSEAEPIERLLIEAPGGSTINKNTDVLQHRGQVSSLCRASAAIALYTFQSWGPAGGAGNRTGLRGGGPLVTMVAPTRHRSLWHLLWANVPCGAPPSTDDLPRVFPWLAPTVTSKTANVVTPENSHPLQCWWGMPRRIRLDFVAGETSRPCDLTGMLDQVVVSSWRQRPHGVNYAAWGSVHPLTPVYQLKAGTEVLPLHPQPGGIGYQHWLGLVMRGADGLRRPATAIAMWRDERAQDADEESRLFAAGYDMDNMKARGFVESEMPLPAPSSPELRQRLDNLAIRLVLSADQVAGLLRSAVRGALFSAGATVSLKAELFSSLRERLWARTEGSFFEALTREARRDPSSPEGVEERLWQQKLSAIAFELFDEAAPMEPDIPPLTRQGEAVPRLVRARRNLLFALQGFGKDGTVLFTTLGLAVAQLKKPGKGKAA